MAKELTGTANIRPWSNEVGPSDQEATTMTPREKFLAELAEKAKNAEAVTYDVTNLNPKALRVIHDFDGEKIAIQPGETKSRVRMHPNLAAYLSNMPKDLRLDP